MALLSLRQFLLLIMSYAIYQIVRKGPRLPYQCSLFSIDCPRIEDITLTEDSSFDPRFERVVQEFKKNFAEGYDIGSGLAIYYKGKQVVDIAAGHVDENRRIKYKRNHMQVIYSSSKSVCAFVVGMLVDRGLLNYEDKVSKYWPEFAQGKKENVTISDLLRHRSGVPYFKSGRKITLEELKDFDKLAELIAKEEHVFDGKPTIAYHFSNYGDFINEIVRRADPKRRNLDEFIKEEINEKIHTSIQFVMSQKEFEKNYIPVHPYPLSHVIFDTVPSVFIVQPISKYFGFRNHSSILKNVINSESGFSKGLNTYDKDYTVDEINNYHTHTAIMAGFNGKSNANSLGRLAGLIANGGKIGNVRLIKEETISKMLQIDDHNDFDVLLELPAVKPIGGFGFHNSSKHFRGKTNYIGWGGYGGSFFGFNTNLKLGMSYVMNSLGNPKYKLDPRALKMYQIAFEIVEQIEAENAK